MNRYYFTTINLLRSSPALQSRVNHLLNAIQREAGTKFPLNAAIPIDAIGRLNNEADRNWVQEEIQTHLRTLADDQLASAFMAHPGWSTEQALLDLTPLSWLRNPKEFTEWATSQTNYVYEGDGVTIAAATTSVAEDFGINAASTLPLKPQAIEVQGDQKDPDTEFRKALTQTLAMRSNLSRVTDGSEIRIVFESQEIAANAFDLISSIPTI